MLQKLAAFFKWTAPLRAQFGAAAGLRLALSLREAIWGATKGSLVGISLPGNPHTIYLRAGSSDAEVFFQVFVRRQAFFPVAGRPSLIVDAGANIGLSAIAFATRFPHARVLALEVDSDNFAILIKNTEPYPNIRPMLNGLWSRRTKLRIVNPEAEAWSLYCREATSSGPDLVEALGVSDILVENNATKIEVLKIDIEGGEYEVFSEGVDEWVGAVGLIAVELHEKTRPGCTEVVRSALLSRGFKESRWLEYRLFQRETLLD